MKKYVQFSEIETEFTEKLIELDRKFSNKLETEEDYIKDRENKFLENGAFHLNDLPVSSILLKPSDLPNITKGDRVFWRLGHWEDYDQPYKYWSKTDWFKEVDDPISTFIDSPYKDKYTQEYVNRQEFYILKNN